MKPKQARVLRLYYYHNLTQEEVADELGITQPSVAYNLDGALDGYEDKNPGKVMALQYHDEMNPAEIADELNVDIKQVYQDMKKVRGWKPTIENE